MKDLFKKNGFKRGILVAAVFILLGVFSGCNLVQMTPEAKKNQVVAKVGKEEYTKQEFDCYFALNEMISQAMYGQGFPTGEELNKAREQYLEYFASDQLTVELGKKEKIKVDTDKENISQQVKEFKKSYQKALGGEEAYNKILKKNGVTTEEFNQYLNNFFVDSQYAQGLQEKIVKDVKVSDKEIKEYYEENKKQYDQSTVSAKHILADADHKKLAEEIAKKAKNGKDFDALMEEYKGKEGISEAADLGEFTYADMVPEFSEAAFALEPGEVSDVVQSTYGFHVIKVKDKNKKPVQSFDKVKDSIQQELLYNAQNEEYQNYVNQKKGEVGTKTYPEKL